MGSFEHIALARPVGMTAFLELWRYTVQFFLEPELCALCLHFFFSNKPGNTAVGVHVAAARVVFCM